MYTNNGFYVALISKAQGQCGLKNKFTATNENCYSNQVLDTQILGVVSLKERNSRSKKVSKFRDNQPKRNRPKHFFCFFLQMLLNIVH